MVIGSEFRTSQHTAIEPAQAVPRVDGQNVELLPIVTLALWLLALGIGVAGSVLGYPVPQREQASAAVRKTQFVDVAVPKAVLPEPKPPPSASPSQNLASVPRASAPTPESPAQMPTQIAEPPAQVPTSSAEMQAPVLAVALPTPSIAFAVPVEGLARIVDVSKAVYKGRVAGSGSGEGQTNTQSQRPTAAPPAVASSGTVQSGPLVMHLTLGEGEGNQPPPEYPREAVSARQQGTVTLRFNVDEIGRVTQVDIITPSRYSNLNRAAVRTVRERWHFPPGEPRVYEVPIEFQITE
jgi:protein TonB